MDPISNQQFSYDFQKFVLQDPNVRVVHMQGIPKPFSLVPPEKSEKSKKDIKKQKQEETKKKEVTEREQHKKDKDEEKPHSE